MPTPSFGVRESGRQLSPDVLSLYNGLGSALVTFTGKGDFALTAQRQRPGENRHAGGLERPAGYAASGTLKQVADVERRVPYHQGDLTIPAGVTLTLNPGTLVLLDGVSSGTNGRISTCRAASNRLARPPRPSPSRPTPPAATGARCTSRGQALCLFLHGNHAGRTLPRDRPHRDRPGHPSLEFHTHVRPRLSRRQRRQDHGDRLRNGPDFHEHAVHPSVMGPEISGTSLVFQNGWIIDMRNKDDADGIYIHDQGPNRACTLTDSVIAGTDDDGIDTLSSDILVQDCIIRNCKDKGISIYGGEVTILHCLLAVTNLAPEDPPSPASAPRLSKAARPPLISTTPPSSPRDPRAGSTPASSRTTSTA